MKLVDLVKPELVFLDIHAQSRDDLMEKLSELLVEAVPELDKEVLNSGLLEREALGGTVVGGGIILPHARVAEAGEELVAFARIEPPLALEDDREEPVWLAAISVTDPERPERHLKLLSQLAKVLHQQECMATLKKADDPKEIARTLKDACREQPKKYQLMLAVLPDDEAVHDYLNLLAGIGIQGATSVTARGMGEILSSGPTLFAGFRELFGAVGSARLVISAMEDALLEPALALFREFKEKKASAGVAFHLPLGGVLGIERAEG